MARRRRKNRTHNRPGVVANESGGPKSFVIRHGQVGSSLAQLVRDVRHVLEPNTASRLKERARNKLKDYITIGPSLQVSHLLAFTLTPIAPILRILRLPSGPTLTFRVERYSLAKDILNTSKRARSVGLEYLTPPLLVCASFPPPGPNAPAHISLLLKAFQSLFPSLSPTTLNLSSARRVVLLSYNAEKETIEFRHYIISVKATGVSKRIRRVVDPSAQKGRSGSVLNLGREKDIADFFLRPRGEPGPAGPEDDGYESAASTTSSLGGDDPANTVDLPDDYVGRNNKKGERRAVRLDEIGPRMELTLLKMTEGLPGKEGSVLYHRFVKKTKKETKQLQAEHEAKALLRKQRREEQERNVELKKKSTQRDRGQSGEDGDVEEDEDEDEDEEGFDEDGDLDEEGEVSDCSDGDDEQSDGGDSSEDEVPEQVPKKRRKA